MAKSKAALEPSGSGPTSLARLKALDTLPDLASQLDEAGKLCTHGARAEMIAKWLLTKLQADSSARVTSGSWVLLQLVVRLLSPERLASLLGTSDLIQIVTTTVTDADGSIELTQASNDCLVVLLDISEGAHAATVKARLSVSAEKAAGFLGAWLGLLVKVCAALDDDRVASYVQTGIRVWTLRKHHAQEDELFGQHCLVPATALLHHSLPEMSTNSSSSKRGAGGAFAAEPKPLETLLARHVFLPARLAFLAQSSQKQQKNQPAKTISLTERLGTMKRAIGSPEQRSLPADSASIMLDITLRCIPAQNARQRTKERPWHETVFSALLHCLASLNSQAKQQPLLSMLRTLQKRGASLGRNTLLQLADEYGIGEANEILNWDVLAQLISLDAGAFARAEPGGKHLDATRLFTLISASADTDSPQPEILKERIVTPIMQAFADNRSLPLFIDLWHAQSRKVQSPNSVWLQLRDVFSHLIESHLTPGYIVEWLKRLRQSSEPAVWHSEAENSVNDDDSSETAVLEFGPHVPAGLQAIGTAQGLLSADCTVIAALLCGIRSPEFQDGVYIELDGLVDQLFRTRYALLDHTYSIWPLARHVLELWFPLWTVHQQKREDIVSRADELNATAITSLAKSYLGRLADKTASNDMSQTKAQDICYYLATATRLFQPYCPSSQGIMDSVVSRAGDTELVQAVMSEELEETAYSGNEVKGLKLKAEMHGHAMQESGSVQTQTASPQVAEMIDGMVVNTDKVAELELLNTVTQHLDGDLTPIEYSAALSAFSRFCHRRPLDSHVGMLDGLLGSDVKSPGISALILAKVVISSLRREDFIGDKMTTSISPQATVYHLLHATEQSTALATTRRGLECLNLVLRTKPFMTNQCIVEASLAMLNRLAQRHDTRLRALYLDICTTFTALLQHHRSRLRDRMHLLVELAQTLISCFYRKLKSSNSSNTKQLTARHARVLARLLQLLCNPPRFTKSKQHTSELVDEGRKAQAHVGQYAQFVLHHYCSVVLTGTPEEGVRPGLMPGMYAAIDAMEVHDGEAVKVLSAAMNNSERAIWRSVYDEYKMFGKWRGG
ncbi:hypothetical protein LTR62_002692 [Meristemomyces frigidus]|uniref:Nucleolar 27S pre-rRNA processing Urb2/Npa2 C-terminal domain-containing protein n=1 Tax=Meristemomyces frigidus TaxID=1508187 RepID=A0AAN7TKL7_9PEZI|nr:hypothetical protein LTR62_002692 [Meristemomyces frigidus]